MELKDIRMRAQKNTKNNFLKKLGIVLIYSLIFFTFNEALSKATTIPAKVVLFILLYAVTVPLSYGVIFCFIKSIRNEVFSIFTFINEAISKFAIIWKVIFRTILKLALPFILLLVASIVSGILITYIGIASTNGFVTFLLFIISIAILAAPTVIFVKKSFSLSLATYLIYDHSELSSKELLEKSEEMMDGNKLTLFKMMLYLSLLIIIFVILPLVLILIYAVNNLSTTSIIVGVALLCIPFILYLILNIYSYELEVAFYDILNTSEKTEE